MIKCPKLRHNVTLERETRTPDTAGGYITAWAEVATFRAQLKPKYQSEAVTGMALNELPNMEITARYSTLLDITNEDRITWGDRIFNILGTINIEEANQWLVIQCRETTRT